MFSAPWSQTLAQTCWRAQKETLRITSLQGWELRLGTGSEDLPPTVRTVIRWVWSTCPSIRPSVWYLLNRTDGNGSRVYPTVRLLRTLGLPQKLAASSLLWWIMSLFFVFAIKKIASGPFCQQAIDFSFILKAPDVFLPSSWPTSLVLHPKCLQPLSSRRAVNFDGAFLKSSLDEPPNKWKVARQHNTIGFLHLQIKSLSDAE